jgi:predicted transcriptional regulator
MGKVLRKIELSAKLDAAVQRVAKRTKRSPSEVVSDAVERMLSDADDIAIDLERWAEYERTGVSIDIEDARKRLKRKMNARRRRATATA